MRSCGIIFSSVLLVTMVFFLGCTTQDTDYPNVSTAPQVVNAPPQIATTAPPLVNVHLPLAMPTQKVVYVTVTTPIPTDTTSVRNVCTGVELPAADIRIIGNIYGIASDPAAGIDEIKFTIGLDSCSQALDLTQMRIVFSTPGTFPQPLMYSTRISTSFFTAKSGTTRITSLKPGELADVRFFVAPVPANTRMTIELKTDGGATMPIIKTAPARISATNLLL